MININKLNLKKIKTEKLKLVYNEWWLRDSQHKACQLKYFADSDLEKRIYRNHCEALIILHHNIKKEWLRRRKRIKDIFAFRILTHTYKPGKRKDCFTKKEYSTDFIDRRIPIDPKKYHWLKDRFQKYVSECKICKKKLYSAEQRLRHVEETHGRHNKVKDIQLPLLLDHPHCICPKCKILLPVYYVKESTNEGTFHCENCDLEIEVRKLQHTDLFYSRQLPRICLKCLKEYKLNKFRWYAQGLLCPTCKEKEENRLKNLRKKRINTP